MIRHGDGTKGSDFDKGARNLLPGPWVPYGTFPLNLTRGWLILWNSIWLMIVVPANVNPHGCRFLVGSWFWKKKNT